LGRTSRFRSVEFALKRYLGTTVAAASSNTIFATIGLPPATAWLS